MRVAFTSPHSGESAAIYTTDWHERGGVPVCRRLSVTRRIVYSALLGRHAVEYAITHIEYRRDRTQRVILDSGVSTFRAAIDALSRELSRLIDEGFAHETDLERLPEAALAAARVG